MRHFVLKVENVSEFPIAALRPEVRLIADLDQLRRDSDFVVDSPDGSFEKVIEAKVRGIDNRALRSSG